MDKVIHIVFKFRDCLYAIALFDGLDDVKILHLSLAFLCKVKGDGFISQEDEKELQFYSVKSRFNLPESIYEIRTVCGSQLDKVLADAADSVIYQHQLKAGIRGGEFIQPRELTELVLALVKEKDCKTIYNPFAGMASYGLTDFDCSYYGQEINRSIYNLAKLRLVLHGVNPVNFTNCDCLDNWIELGFDCVLSSPPFGGRFSPEIRHQTGVTTYEDYVIKRFLFGNAKYGMFIMPRSFCTRGQGASLALRGDICNFNLLEMVVNLPIGIFSSTGISSSLIVLSRDRRKDEDVLFVDAEELFVYGERRKKIIDTQMVLSVIKNSNHELCYKVPLEELYKKDFSFDASRYSPQIVNVGVGQRVIALGEVLTQEPGERIAGNPRRVSNVVKGDNFTDNIVRFEDVNNVEFVDEHAIKYHGPHLAINRMGKIYIHKGDTDFYVSPNDYVFKVNNSVVDTEYLAMKILDDPLFYKRLFRGGVPRINMTLLLEFKIAIDSLSDQQRQIVNKRKRDYLANERQRLGIREAGGDLSHMLGMPKHSIGSLVACLMLSDTLTDEEKEMVKAIDDNFKYTLRLVNLVGADFSTMSLTSHVIPIAQLVREYINSLKNLKFSNNYSVEEEITLPDDVTVNCDEDMIRVILDTAFRNAYKHGFGQEYSENNVVKLGCRVVEYHGSPFVCISVANNGKPMPAGFSVEDFATKGKKAGKTGNTGKGGFHIYSIAKKYNGYINISSSQEWPFVLDVLMPAENIDNLNITEVYDDECL